MKHALIIVIKKGAKALLFQYKWNYVAGLLDVFPNIGFDKSKFNVESSLPS